MERKKALALAGTLTFVLGSATVAAAATGHVALLGFDGGGGRGPGSFAATVASAKPRVVTKTHDVYDKVVVDAGNAGAPAGSNANPSSGSPGASPASSSEFGTPQGPAAPTPTSEAPPDTLASHPHSGDDTNHGTPPAAPPTTAAPAPAPEQTPPAPATTTVPTTTPTTRPPGVPADWPANKPIPPMPPNCHQPQLEDNGVWNCQTGGRDD
jgi:hypothetical protein